MQCDRVFPTDSELEGLAAKDAKSAKEEFGFGILNHERHENHEIQVGRLPDYFVSFVYFVVDLLVISNLASLRPFDGAQDMLCESNIRKCYTLERG